MSFLPGDKVFAKIKGFSFWPARINPLPDHVRVPKGRLPIFFYGTHQVSFVPIKAVVSFDANVEKFGKPKTNATFTHAMEEISSNPDILMLGRDPDALFFCQQLYPNGSNASKRSAVKKPTATGKKRRQTEEIVSDHDSLSSISSISDNDDDSYIRSEAVRKAEIDAKLRELEEKRQKEEEKAIRKAERQASKASRKRIQAEELEPSPSYSPILPLGILELDANIPEKAATPISVVESVHDQISPSLEEEPMDVGEQHRNEKIDDRKAARKMEKKEAKKAAKLQAKIEAKKKAKAAALKRKELPVSPNLESPSSSAHNNYELTFSPILPTLKTNPALEIKESADSHGSPYNVVDEEDDDTGSQKPLIFQSPSTQLITTESETEIARENGKYALDDEEEVPAKVTHIDLVDIEGEHEVEVKRHNRKRMSLMSSEEDSDAEIITPRKRSSSSSEVNLMEEEEKRRHRFVKKSPSKRHLNKVSLDSSSDEEEIPSKRKHIKSYSHNDPVEPKTTLRKSLSPVKLIRAPSPDPTQKLNNFSRQLKASLIRGHENFSAALSIFQQISEVSASLVQLTQAWELTDCVKKCRRYKISAEIRVAAQKTLAHFQSIQAKASKEQVMQAQAIVAERVKQAKALAASNAPPVVTESVEVSRVETPPVSTPPTAVPILPTWEEKRASITAELDARVNEVLNRIRASDERVAATNIPGNNTPNNYSNINHRMVDEDERVISQVEEVANEFEAAEASRHRKSSAPPLQPAPLDNDLDTRIRMMTEGGLPPPPPPPLAAQMSSLPADLLAKRHHIARKLAAKKAAMAAKSSSLMPEMMTTATPVLAGVCTQDEDIYDLLGV